VSSKMLEDLRQACLRRFGLFNLPFWASMPDHTVENPFTALARLSDTLPISLLLAVDYLPAKVSPLLVLLRAQASNQSSSLKDGYTGFITGGLPFPGLLLVRLHILGQPL